MRRNQVQAYYDAFPHSPAVMRKIKNRYIVYEIKWCALDPPVSRLDLEEMEQLLNEEFLRHSS